MTAPTIRDCPFCGGQPQWQGAAIRCAPCDFTMTPHWEKPHKNASITHAERFSLAQANAASRWNQRPAKVRLDPTMFPFHPLEAELRL